MGNQQGGNDVSNGHGDDYVRAQADAENWEQICPADPAQCAGQVRLSDAEVVRCPVADTACPYRAERAVEERVRYLAGIGVPPDAQRPELSRVPDDIREGVELYVTNIDLWIPKGEGMWLLGSIGAGKSCALALAARAAYDKGVLGAVFVHSAQLFDDLHHLRSERYEETPLLLIDEYGVEWKGDWNMVQWRKLMHYRLNYRKSTCFATNTDSATLASDPDIEPIVSRWQDRNNWLETAAESQRGRLTLDDWRVAENDSEVKTMHRQEIEEEPE